MENYLSSPTPNTKFIKTVKPTQLSQIIRACDASDGRTRTEPFSVPGHYVAFARRDEWSRENLIKNHEAGIRWSAIMRISYSH
jgi:hypothetical protein